MFDSLFPLAFALEMETNSVLLEAIIITHYAVQEIEYRFSITHEIESSDNKKPAYNIQ